MNNLRITKIPIFLSIILTFTSLPTYANYSWTFSKDTTPNQGSCGVNAAGNTCTQSSTFNGQTIGLQATGWASSTSDTARTSPINKAALNLWDGLAVQSSYTTTTNVSGVTTITTTQELNTAPEHATDNNGALESILFTFNGGPVTLQTITMGWHKDSDFSLLRYTGNTLDLTTQSYSTLINSGWELVGDYYYSGNPTTKAEKNADYTFGVNSSLRSSSNWLVVAMNPIFGTSDASFDYFKVKTLTGDKANITTNNNIPEPTSFLLLLAGVLAWRVNKHTLEI